MFETELKSVDLLELHPPPQGWDPLSTGTSSTDSHSGLDYEEESSTTAVEEDLGNADAWALQEPPEETLALSPDGVDIPGGLNTDTEDWIHVDPLSAYATWLVSRSHDYQSRLPRFLRPVRKFALTMPAIRTPAYLFPRQPATLALTAAQAIAAGWQIWLVYNPPPGSSDSDAAGPSITSSSDSTSFASFSTRSSPPSSHQTASLYTYTRDGPDSPPSSPSPYWGRGRQHYDEVERSSEWRGHDIEELRAMPMDRHDSFRYGFAHSSESSYRRRAR